MIPPGSKCSLPCPWPHQGTKAHTEALHPGRCNSSWPPAGGSLLLHDGHRKNRLSIWALGWLPILLPHFDATRISAGTSAWGRLGHERKMVHTDWNLKTTYSIRGCSSSYWPSCKSHQEKSSNMCYRSCPLNWRPQAGGGGPSGCHHGVSWQWPPRSTSYLTPGNAGSARRWCFSAKFFLIAVTHLGDIYEAGKLQKTAESQFAEGNTSFSEASPRQWLADFKLPLLPWSRLTLKSLASCTHPWSTSPCTTVHPLPLPSPASLPSSPILIVKTTPIHPRKAHPWLSVCSPDAGNSLTD